MASSTKDLKKVLTRGNLMSMAVGQIIGAGVMVMSITALGMTGRSVNIAFVIAAIFTIVGAIPTIFYTSVVRLRGGMYSQAALFCGEKFAGYYIYTYIISNLTMAMYALGFTSYFISLFPVFKGKDKIVTIVVLTVFFTLNYFGQDKVAKIQDFLFYLLVAALLMFTLFGLPKVHWAGYFGNELFDAPLFENGVSGLLQAAAYLTFATGGATVIVNFSAEAINPTKDIPFVLIVSTLGVALLYAFMATVIGGVLPAPQVIEAGNLAVIAEQIMPKPCYYFFLIGGAMTALATTLNAQIGWVTKPLLQAIEDGWFPASMGKLSKYKTPYILQIMFYVISVSAVLANFDVGQIGKVSLILGNITNIILAMGLWRLPTMFKEQWEKSPFHVSDAVYKSAIIAAVLFLILQFYMNCKGTALKVVILNAVTFVVAILVVIMRTKAGKVNMTVSYDLE